MGRKPTLLPSGKRRKLQIRRGICKQSLETRLDFSSSIPVTATQLKVSLDCAATACCLSFAFFTRSKFPIHSETNESHSPVPRHPQISAEAIPWWVARGQSSSCCGCCLCQLNTVTFDLSFCPLCLSTSASRRAL